jgi:hypothetical protein
VQTAAAVAHKETAALGDCDFGEDVAGGVADPASATFGPFVLVCVVAGGGEDFVVRWLSRPDDAADACSSGRCCFLGFCFLSRYAALKMMIRKCLIITGSETLLVEGTRFVFLIIFVVIAE